MLTFYFVSLVLGLVFGVLALVFSVAYQTRTDLGGDVPEGDDHFPFFHPLAVAGSITVFGSIGILGLKLFARPPVLSLPIALGAGLLAGTLTWLVARKIDQTAQTKASAIGRSLVGQPAQVDMPILARGVGTITFSKNGRMLSGPARGEKNQDIPRQAPVTVTRVAGGLYYVKENDEERANK